MEKKVNISLPKGNKAKNVKFKFSNGSIEVTYDLEDKLEPKDGDFLVDEEGEVFIYNGIHDYDSYGCYAGAINSYAIRIEYTKKWVSDHNVRFSTSEEKSAFLERLEKELGKTWNAKKKCLEDIYVPKFGDIVKVVAPRKAERNYMICIFHDKEIPKEQTNNFYDIANVARNISLSNGCGFVLDQTIVPASESEKQELFDKLAEVGKRWNPDTKQLEDIRWRAKVDEGYYFINDQLEISRTNDGKYTIDEKRYQAGNYFFNPGEAQKVIVQIKDIFKNSKAE